jgi:hypothetical protein
MSKAFLRKSTKVSMSVFSRFVLSRFQVLLSNGSSKRKTNYVLQNHCVEKCLQNKRQKDPNPIVSKKQLITFLGVSRFSVRGV